MVPVPLSEEDLELYEATLVGDRFDYSVLDAHQD